MTRPALLFKRVQVTGAKSKNMFLPAYLRAAIHDPVYLTGKLVSYIGAAAQADLLDLYNSDLNLILTIIIVKCYFKLYGKTFV